MDWYAVHTKPRQEQRALVNLERQGYECYLPILTVEVLSRGATKTRDEALFPRYLFIRLDAEGTGKSWAPIRSTKGVNRLVSFGADPAKVDVRLIEDLRSRDPLKIDSRPKPFTQGERVLVAEGPFAGLEAIYQMDDGESRAMVLIELLSRSTRLATPLSALKRPD